MYTIIETKELLDTTQTPVNNFSVPQRIRFNNGTTGWYRIEYGLFAYYVNLSDKYVAQTDVNGIVHRGRINAATYVELTENSNFIIHPDNIKIDTGDEIFIFTFNGRTLRILS